jgi:hypothetical protein
MKLSDVEHVTHNAQHELAHALPNLDAFDILTTTSDTGSKPHAH